MRRLHSQFYLAILATLAVFLVVGTVLFWMFAGEWHRERSSVATAGELAQALLPPASASAAEQQQSLDELEQRLRIELALYDREGQLLAATQNVPRPTPRELANEGWTGVRDAGRCAVASLHRPRGRWRYRSPAPRIAARVVRRGGFCPSGRRQGRG